MLKKIATLVISCLFSSVLYAKPKQIIPETDLQVKLVYDIQTYAFESNPSYKIWVAVPKALNEKSKVIYLLDANAQLPLFLNQLMNKPKDNYPVLVGIGYDTPNAYATELRTYDYTPAVSGKAFNQGGGFKHFYHFIKEELKPWVNKTVKVSNHKTILFGHSFGGLFTLMAYQSEPDLFNLYISASPSLWWGEGQMVNLNKLKQSAVSRTIIFTQGEKEHSPNPLTVNKIEKEDNIKRRSWINVEQVYKTLSAENRAIQFYIFKDQSHGSSIPFAIDKAIIFALNNETEVID